MHIVVATDADRDFLVAEIHLIEGHPWIEVRYDSEREAYVASFFTGADGSEITVDLAEVLRVLHEAHGVLVARGYPNLPVL